MRYLDATEIKVKGPQRVNLILAKTDAFFQDVKVLAVRVPADYDQNLLDLPGTKLKSDRLTTNKTSGEIRYTLLQGKSALDIVLPKDETVRSLVLYPGDHADGNVTVQIKADSGYLDIKKADFHRAAHVENLAEGFEPGAPFLLSLPPYKGRDFRLVFQNENNKAGELKNIVLSATPVVANLTEKKLAKITDASLPWENTSKELSDQAGLLQAGDVLDISRYLKADGRLKWNAPKGNWLILRTGMRFIDVRNGPASFEAEGLEVDKMNKADVKFHFNAFVGQILKRIPAADRKSLKMVIMDSYERGGTNFTDDFLQDFQKRYGYDPTPYLPAYFGHIIGSRENTDRFLWDVRRLVADKVAANYVGGLREASHENGLQTWLENYGNSPAEFLQYGGQSDNVAGEYWVGKLGNPNYKFLCRAASSAAHIYGKDKAWAESFTSGSWNKSYEYSTYPQELKSLGDWAFCQGINSTVLHLYIQQAYENIYPGIDAWFGTEFNRKNTWFKHMDLFTQYHRRCNYMLQQGKNVADIAYYIGEDNPITKDPLTVKIPKGFNYDYINSEVIIKYLKVTNGRFVLPDGTSYRVLMLPPRTTMRPEVIEKIAQLVAAGGVVMGNPPSQSPSLQNYPTADRIVKTLANQIWGTANEKQHRYGKGMVFRQTELTDVLNSLGITTDFEVDASAIDYTHRTLNGKEIYFIANTSGKKTEFTATFRVSGLQPEFWDALTGVTRTLPTFGQAGATTKIPLKLDANGSAFIVFDKKDAASAQTLAANFPDPTIMSTLDGPWTVTFEHDSVKRGPKEPVLMPMLMDWSKSADKRIRNYSGAAIYNKMFSLTNYSKENSYYLDLCNLSATAKVKVNGKYVGGIWTFPYRVNITGAVRDGENNVEIEVINTWKNRLIGDHNLPAQQRIVQSRINPWNGDSTLQPSGLWGPVTLLAVKK